MLTFGAVTAPRKLKAKRKPRVTRPAKPSPVALATVQQRLKPVTGHIENVAALAPFFSRLARAANELVPILQFGDSHSASDDWVHSMRVRFQSKYGNGGPGFVTAGQFRYYRRWDAKVRSSAGWLGQGTIGKSGDQQHGLSGLSVTATRANETASLTASVANLDLWFRRQPEGGSFTIEVDDQPGGAIETQGELSTGVTSISIPQGEHQVTIRTSSMSPVRLFGWVAQNQQGVTWETLGINGAQAGLMLEWDQSLWTEQLHKRNPALVLIAYGTNEALSRKWTAEEYRQTLKEIATRVRRTAPNASLLLVGPPDCGRTRPFPHLAEVIAVQRQVAREMGIAFWDWRAHMGGPGANRTWVRAGLAQPDYTHLTSEGYRATGAVLAGELELEFEAWASWN